MKKFIHAFFKAVNELTTPVLRLCFWVASFLCYIAGDYMLATFWIVMIIVITVGLNETKLERIEKKLDIDKKTLELQTKNINLNQARHEIRVEKYKKERCQHKNSVGFMCSKTGTNCLICPDCKQVLKVEIK